MKYVLDHSALRRHVPLIEKAVLRCFHNNVHQAEGHFAVIDRMGDLVRLSAVICLQGQQMEKFFDSDMKSLYHDLECGMTPMNFVFPRIPLPRNRKRDRAQKALARFYESQIHSRRSSGAREEDMLWHLMQCRYKDGSPLPDKEICHIMIALVMGGQHSATATASWVMLRLASEPQVLQDLYREQIDRPRSGPLSLDDIEGFRKLKNVVRETFRVHPPLHSLLRVTQKPVKLGRTGLIVPSKRILLASPAYASKAGGSFRNQDNWDPDR